MIRLYRETKAFFFIVSVRNEQTLDRNHAFDRIPKKKAGAILARLLGRAARTRPAFL